jgi:hypothetical protein
MRRLGGVPALADMAREELTVSTVKDKREEIEEMSSCM